MNVTRRSLLAITSAAAVSSQPKAKVRALTSGPKHHFFGYYGVSPWNRAGDSLICLETEFQHRMPRAGEPASVMLADVRSGKLRKIGETRAWNLQQGCMLNWNPRVADEVLFNDAEAGELITAAVNIKNGKRRTWPRAIESVGGNGKVASCVTYGRLARLRPVVGYAGAKDPYPNENHPQGDGVWMLDLDSGASRLAVSIRQVYDYLAPRHPELKNKPMFFQHSVLNPASTRFFFLARINEQRLTSAMFTANIDGSGLSEVVDFGRGVSHFAWRGNQEIMATFRLDDEMRHVLFPDGTKDYRAVGEGFLVGDGHCSFGRDPQWLVTDRNVADPPSKKLFLYHLGRKQGIEIGAFPMRLPNGETYLSGDTRCDLHPRWKDSGDAICFDAIETSGWTRQVHIAALEGL